MLASEDFSSSEQRAILSSVIVVVLGLELRLATQPYPAPLRWPPPWISRPPTPDSRRSLRRATYPQLLHHHRGHNRRSRSQHDQRCRPSRNILQLYRGYRPDRPFRLITNLLQLDGRDRFRG